MNCSNCHNEIPDDSAFCNKCGSPVIVVTPDPQNVTEIADDKSIYETNKEISEFVRVKDGKGKKVYSKKNKLMLIFMLFAILLTGIIGQLTDYTFSYEHYQYKKYIAIDNDGNNALLRSIYENDVVKTKVLLDLGVDFNIINKALDTALIIGVRNNNEEIVKDLLEKGAETEVLDKTKNTPLLIAAENGYSPICKMLIESGANINSVNVNDETILTLAIKKGDINSVKMYMDNGIRINTVDKNKDTALLLAVKLKSYDIVELLAEKSISVNTKDINNNTVYQVVAHMKDEKMMNLLVKNRKNNTIPLHLQRSELTGVGFYSVETVNVEMPNDKMYDFYANDGIKVLLDADGNKLYEGKIENAHITGFGTAYTTKDDYAVEANQIIYVGNWRNGVWEGSGKSYWTKTSLEFLRSNIASTWGTEENALAFYNQEKNTVFYETTYVNGFRQGSYTRYYSDGALNDTGFANEGNNSSNVYKDEPIKKSPSIGMSAAEIEISSWGKPEDINTTTTINGTTEQWVYSEYRYLYFDNGVLTAIQN